MNPEIKAMKERVEAYRQQHPEYRKRPERPLKRRKMRTKRQLRKDTRCVYCGKVLTKHNATFDHIVPLSRGGSNDPENLCWCCASCNKAKSNKLLSEWMALRGELYADEGISDLCQMQANIQ